MASDYLSLTLNRWGWMGANHIVNTHTIDARVGGRSRYPGRAARGPVADIGASIAEADSLRRAGALPQALQVIGRAVDLVWPAREALVLAGSSQPTEEAKE